MVWAPEAAQALKGVPRLVRPLARRKVEERVRDEGGARVSLADFRSAEARFRGGAGRQGLPGAGRPAARPQPPRRGAGGPGVLPGQALRLPQRPHGHTDPWRQALQDWLAAKQISERLRAKVEGDQVLFHHKLRLALAGCPNGCSRPQIADLALVGTLSPVFDPADCHRLRRLRRSLPRRGNRGGRRCGLGGGPLPGLSRLP